MIKAELVYLELGGGTGSTFKKNVIHYFDPKWEVLKMSMAPNSKNMIIIIRDSHDVFSCEIILISLNFEEKSCIVKQRLKFDYDIKKKIIPADRGIFEYKLK